MSALQEVEETEMSDVEEETIGMSDEVFPAAESMELTDPTTSEIEEHLCELPVSDLEKWLSTPSEEDTTFASPQPAGELAGYLLGPFLE